MRPEPEQSQYERRAIQLTAPYLHHNQALTMSEVQIFTLFRDFFPNPTGNISRHDDNSGLLLKGPRPRGGRLVGQKDIARRPAARANDLGVFMVWRGLERRAAKQGLRFKAASHDAGGLAAAQSHQRMRCITIAGDVASEQIRTTTESISTSIGLAMWRDAVGRCETARRPLATALRRVGQAHGSGRGGWEFGREGWEALSQGPAAT